MSTSGVQNQVGGSTTNKRVRMKDIATSLGISISTVSRALNPDTTSRISPDVVAEIKKTASDLGYITDITASSMRKQKTFTAGMVVPDVLNPVFPPIMKGVQQYLSARGFVTFTVYSDNNQDTATAEIQKLIGRRVDGLIVASAFLEDRSVKYCIDQGTPLVLVNRSILQGDKVHQVLDNDTYGISLAIDHLYELNHRKLAYIAGPQDVLQGTERLQAFIQCCMNKAIPYNIVNVDAFSIEAGKEGARQVLAQKLDCTGLLAGNDLIAIGAIKVFNESGVKVPEQLSVVGFNDMPLADMLNPPLTTVSIPHHHLGEQAARLLIEEIESPDGPRHKILLTPTLAVRGSTAKACS